MGERAYGIWRGHGGAALGTVFCMGIGIGEADQRAKAFEVAEADKDTEAHEVADTDTSAIGNELAAA